MNASNPSLFRVPVHLKVCRLVSECSLKLLHLATLCLANAPHLLTSRLLTVKSATSTPTQNMMCLLWCNRLIISLWRTTPGNRTSSSWHHLSKIAKPSQFVASLTSAKQRVLSCSTSRKTTAMRTQFNDASEGKFNFLSHNFRTWIFFTIIINYRLE